MTAGAQTQDGQEKARRWQSLRELPSRTSLRVKLLASLLALVIVALVAMACVGFSLLRGQLISTLDGSIPPLASNEVAACAEAYANGNTGGCRVDFDLYWIAPGGQVFTVPTPLSSPNFGGYLHSGQIPSPPQMTSGQASWLTGHPHQGTTVRAQSGSGRWRLMGFPVYDQNNDYTGTVVVAVSANSVYNTLRELAVVDVIVSAAIVVVLTIVGFAMVQANLRALVDIEETAGEIAEGHLNRRVPERDPRTEIGRLGRSLNLMLNQIEAAFHAREESEAAAHQSEERMRRFIADASHELRTPLTAIRGFAEYYRHRGGLVKRWDRDQPAAPGPQGGLLPDDLDRIMQRLEKEAARMGLLVEDLLLLARMDQQRPLARQPIDLLSLAADAVHDTRLLAPDRTIELSVQRGAAFLVTRSEERRVGKEGRSRGE